MFKRFAALAAMVVMCACLFSCGNKEPCASRMDSIRAQRGAPEEINDYSSSDYHSVTWWYWSSGISYTFTWGSAIDGCDVSTYTFPPISADAPPEFKAVAMASKKLVSHTVYLDVR